MKAIQLSTAIAGLLAAAASAQSAGPVTTSPAGGVEIEEVIVTAERRSQDIQDVPVSITALSGGAIAELGMKTSVDVAAQVPNLTIKQSFAASVPQIFLRGVGINDPNANANGAIGIYVDEVNLVSPMALTFQLYDTQRVEVLRGPQGTLYGRNTTGGAMNFISRKPTREFEGYASVGYGRFQSLRVEGAVSGPLSETVAWRLAGIVEDNDGFHSNRVTGNDDLGDLGRWSARGLLQFKPSDAVEVLINLHGGHVSNHSTPFEFAGTVDLATGGPCDYRFAACTDFLGYRDADGDPYAHDIDFEGHTRFENVGTSATVNIDFGSMKLTSISAYENTERNHREDADASPNNVLNTYFFDDSKQYSQELRLASTGEQRISWIAGLFYSRETTDIHNRYDFFRGYRDLVESFGFPGGFDPDGANPTGLTPFLIDQRFDQKARSYAAFLHTDTRLSERLSLTAGLRYTSEKRRIRQNTVFDEETFDIPLVDQYSDQTKFSAVSGKIGLNFTLTDNALLYASVSRGFKSGGYNGALVFSADELQPFDKETITAWEAGAKTTFLDRRLVVNGAAFYYDYNDLQLYTFTNVGGVPVQLLTNASSAEIYGAELEISARPTEPLTLSLGAGLLHTALKGFRSDGGVDLSGNRLVLAPSTTLNGLARYEFPVRDTSWKIAVQTDFRYQDKVYFSTANSPLLAQPGYWIWNARLSLLEKDDRWEIAAQVRNIGDKDYRTEAFDFSSAGWNLYIFGTPRTYELTATVRF